MRKHGPQEGRPGSGRTAVALADDLYAEGHFAQGLSKAALHYRVIRQVDDQGGEAPREEEHPRHGVVDPAAFPPVEQRRRRGEQARHDAQ
jgi:hypothetical protein